MQGLPTEAAGWLGWAGTGSERRDAEGWLKENRGGS